MLGKLGLLGLGWGKKEQKSYKPNKVTYQQTLKPL